MKEKLIHITWQGKNENLFKHKKHLAAPNVVLKYLLSDTTQKKKMLCVNMTNKNIFQILIHFDVFENS